MSDTGGIKSTSDTCILGVISCGWTTHSCRRSNHEGHGHGYQREAACHPPTPTRHRTRNLIRHGWFNLATGLAAASWGFADPPTSLAARGIVRRLQRYVAATSQPFLVHHIHRLQSPGRYEATPCISSPCPSRGSGTRLHFPPPPFPNEASAAAAVHDQSRRQSCPSHAPCSSSASRSSSPL